MTSSKSSVSELVTIDQAQQIIRAHLAEHDQCTVKSLSQIENKGYSYTPGYRIYILDLDSIAAPGHPSRACSCFLMTMTTSGATHVNESSDSETYQFNTIQLIHQILGRIRDQSDIPTHDSILDTSLDLVPFHYILCPSCPFSSSDIVSLSTARQSGLLNPTDALLIDLQIGKYLGQLHSNVQNDWFGLPQLETPRDPSYSWQETFTLLFETLLSELEAAEIVQLPYEEIRSYFCRAIGSFLFDDVEVPSLIWFTGSDHDVYVSLPADTAAEIRGVVAILPNFANALWGDPLLETFFLPPNPSTVMLEGYSQSGGGPLTILQRHKTKRAWYTLFLALVVLKQRAYTFNIGAYDQKSVVSTTEINQAWVTKTIIKTIEFLRDAPTY